MFKNNSTFFRIIVHTVGVLLLIGILGSTAFGGEDLFSTVIQTLYAAAFGTTQASSTTVTTDTLSGSGTGNKRG